MKKKLILFLIIMCSLGVVYAQSPEKISYQAVIRNVDNSLLVNTSIGMRISILINSTNGDPVYIETQNTSTNINGLVTLEIGNGNPVDGTFSSVDWGMGTYFIKIETDPNGGDNYSISGTSQLLSVPYALHAKTASSANNGFNHYVGEVFDGGVIFHVYKAIDGSEHGLIVSLQDQGEGIPWSNLSDTAIGGSARSSWNGQNNSEAILNQVGHNQSAAELCQSYESIDGFNDWYLPSIDELTLLFNRRFDVNRVLNVVGQEIKMLDNSQNFNYLFYWSSTEINNEQSWRYSFTPGANDFSHFGEKSSLNNVRAIRSF